MNTEILSNLLHIYHVGEPSKGSEDLSDLIDGDCLKKSELSPCGYTVSENGVNELILAGLINNLFEHYKGQASAVTALLDKYISEFDNESLEHLSRAQCILLQMELEELGFTIDYGLDLSPFNLVKLPAYRTKWKDIDTAIKAVRVSVAVLCRNEENEPTVFVAHPIVTDEELSVDSHFVMAEEMAEDEEYSAPFFCLNYAELPLFVQSANDEISKLEDLG